MSGWLLTVELARRGGEARVLKPRTIEDTCWIGRTGENAIAIREDNVSRRHCCLIVRDGEVFIKDGGSSNGTWVSGSRVVGLQRFDADARLYLGNHVLRLLAAPEPYVGWYVTLAITGRSGGDERQVTAAMRYVGEDRHELTFGSGADLVVGRNASRVHCALVLDGAGETWIVDRGSTNGTYVEGARVERARFEVGHRLHVGDMVIRMVAPPVGVVPV